MTEKKTELNTKEEFRDSVATIDQSGRRVWLYPKKPKGKLYHYRSLLSYIYLVLFFGLPFIKIDGDPFFMFNVVERKFVLFGMIFWPQDFFVFGIGFLVFIVFIALFTVIYGRVFCGWACPQTVFMEMIFRRIEYLIEGDANHIKSLDNQPWNRKKVLKRGTKFLAFYLIAFLISNTFLAYIIGIDEVIKIISEPIALHKAGLFSIALFSLIFFFVYAWFREQVCLIVCPYGRMQGVLLDKNSIVVAYDHVRGEPRHKFRKNEDSGKGDCVDCGLCVKVCPTGIDIRNGTQLECVNCTACIDECNEIMRGVQRPEGLIRYASESEIEEKRKSGFTFRMKAYTVVLILLMGLEAFLIIGRSDVDATILRARGLLYQEQPNNQTSNLYSIKLINKTRKDFPLQLKVENYEGKIQLIGKDFLLKKEAMLTGEFFVFLNNKDINQRKMKLEIGLYSGNKKIKSIKTNFLGPVSR